MIVLSHRGPYRFQRCDDGTFIARRGAGGVVSALGPLLSEKRETTAERPEESGAGGRLIEADATWIAAALSDDDRAAVHSGIVEGLDIDLDLLDLDPVAHRMHYEVIANGVLWFLHHGMFDRIRRPRFDRRFREAWAAYVSVNEAFSDAAARHARERDIVLVQDYQLALVPGQLKARRPDLRIVHFTHTPFCGADDISVLPDDIATELCRSLASGPAGFHTKRWADAYNSAARATLGLRSNVTAPFAASLGPDVAALDEVADSPEARRAAAALADTVGERRVILRTDRIEPSKNIVRGFLAYDRLLEARPGLRGRVVFVAMVYPSREGLAEYLAYGNEVEQVVDRINERWATSDWTPIVLDARDDFARSVAGLQRYDVLVVNPLRDGLNLVAKEGPACNRRDGVLCLSPEAGAFDELEPAVVKIHPYDIEQAAGALDTALAMPLDDRAMQAKHLRSLATARTPAGWLRDLVGHAGK